MYQSPPTPWTRRRLLVGGASLLIPATLHGAREQQTATANPVVLWNEALIRGVKAQTPPPALTARNLAILHLAMWRTATKATSTRDPDAVLSAALNAAGHEICLALFPSQRAEMDALFHRIRGTGLPPRSFETRAEKARGISRSVLESRAADGSSTTIHYVPRSEPGQWRRTPTAMRPPELPHWGKVTPFLLKSPDQFRPPPPPEINGAGFAADLQEVRDLGGSNSSTRTARETETARFWSDFSYTTSPPGHWNDIARSFAGRVSLTNSTRLLALLNMAMADAGIATWDCKYHYNFWRPVTALNLPNNESWAPLLQSPPHPEYVSGHSAFSGAAVAILESFFGTPALSFSVASDTVKNVTRPFRNLHECADEISRSRVLGGIHFATSCREGLALGRNVAQWTTQEFDRMQTSQKRA